MAKQIHIVDGRTDNIVSYIPEVEYWNDERVRELVGNRDTFDFETFADEEYSQFLTGRNRIIVPNRDGSGMSEFIIEEDVQYLDNESGFHFSGIFANASYLELRKQKIIAPQVVNGFTPQQHMTFALTGTEWTVGEIDYAPQYTATLTAHMDAYSYLLDIAERTGFELQFRIEHNGYKVTRRIVDLLDRSGTWRGHEVAFGKDLMEIERIRKHDGVVTALIGIGPSGQTAYVEDLDALERWGREGRHLIEAFTPQFAEGETFTTALLTSKTKAELTRRIASQTEYSTTIETLAQLLDTEPSDIQFGDIIRIKDEEFNPPIYLEARIHTMTESIKDYGESKVTLGDFTEFTEDEVKSILSRMQREIADKIGNAELVEVIAEVAELKRVYSTTAPADTRVIWVDTSVRPLVQRVWLDAVEGWVKMTPTTAAEVNADPAGTAEALGASLRDDISEIVNELDSFQNDYEAFTTDGFVSRAEAISIERYINSLEAEKDDVDAQYTTLYNNGLLLDAQRDALLTAKMNYDGAHGALISQINTSIADGYATAAERLAVNNAYATYRTNLGALSVAITNATKQVMEATVEPVANAVDKVETNTTPEAISGIVLTDPNVQKELDKKADADAIGDLATKTELGVVSDGVDEKIATAIGAIDNEDLATKEALAAMEAELKKAMGARGGMNLLRNSVGYAELTHWTGSGGIITVMNDALETIGFGCGFYFPPNGSTSVLEQIVNVVPGEAHTLSWYVQKAAAGTFTIEFLEAGVIMETVTLNLEISDDFKTSYYTYTPKTTQVGIRFTSNSTADITLTGLMFSLGALPAQWTLATGELYNAYVRTDERGIVVIRLNEQGDVEGYTNMSPTEFAIYYDENHDGNAERVFWFNKDETVTKKLRALEEITMGTIKIVRVEGTANRGWAFVPIVPE